MKLIGPGIYEESEKESSGKFYDDDFTMDASNRTFIEEEPDVVVKESPSKKEHFDTFGRNDGLLKEIKENPI